MQLNIKTKQSAAPQCFNFYGSPLVPLTFEKFQFLNDQEVWITAVDMMNVIKVL